jgi:predicted aspartyl protease
MAPPDSGASVSVISKDYVTRYGLKVNHHCQMRIKAANDQVMHCDGSVTLTLVVLPTGKSKNVTFVVSQDLSNEILLSYSELKVLKVLPTHFPFAICRAVSVPRTAEEVCSAIIAHF